MRKDCVNLLYISRNFLLGGAGAPIRDERGNVVTQVYGKIKKEVSIFIIESL